MISIIEVDKCSDCLLRVPVGWCLYSCIHPKANMMGVEFRVVRDERCPLVEGHEVTVKLKTEKGLTE